MPDRVAFLFCKLRMSGQKVKEKQPATAALNHILGLADVKWVKASEAMPGGGLAILMRNP